LRLVPHFFAEDNSPSRPVIVGRLKARCQFVTKALATKTKKTGTANPFQFPFFEKEGIFKMSTKRIGKRILLFSGTALLAGVTAVAQAPGSGPAVPTNPNPQQVPTAPGAGMPDNTATSPQQFSDHAFVSKALEGGVTEVQLGQLAQQKSQSPDVKQFGEKMVQDHSLLGEQMKQIAKVMGVNEPKGPSKKDKQLIAKLEGMSGTEFDQEYIKAMVKDHKQDLKDFKDEAQMTQDPNLQQVTKTGTNVISQHLQMIEQIAQAHNVSTEASNKKN
jgi:putative membrane protein